MSRLYTVLLVLLLAYLVARVEITTIGDTVIKRSWVNSSWESK